MNGIELSQFSINENIIKELKSLSEQENPSDDNLIQIRKILADLKNQLDTKRKSFDIYKDQVSHKIHGMLDNPSYDNLRPKPVNQLQAPVMQSINPPITKPVVVPNREKLQLKPDMPIWKNTDIFFKGIRPKKEYEQLFHQTKVELQKFNPTNQHWSKTFEIYAEDARRINNSVASPPHPGKGNTEPKDINLNLSFQIENQQKVPDSKFLRLLNALVVSCPIESKQKSDKKFPFRHTLAPRIPYHSYLSLDFKERLDLELQGLNLGSGTELEVHDDEPFSEEILNYKKKLDLITPKLEKLSHEIIDKIDDFIKIDQRLTQERNNLLQNYVIVQE